MSVTLAPRRHVQPACVCGIVNSVGLVLSHYKILCRLHAFKNNSTVCSLMEGDLRGRKRWCACFVPLRTGLDALKLDRMLCITCTSIHNVLDSKNRMEICVALAFPF